MFTDIVSSTAVAAALGDRRWRELLSSHHELIRGALVRFSGTELDTAGDGFFARFERPLDAVSCACAITDAVRRIGIDVRIGIHADGTVSSADRLDWIFVAIANRVSSLAASGEVLITGTTAAMIAETTIECEAQGMYTLEGIPAEWSIFAVKRDESQRPLKVPLPAGVTLDSSGLPRATRSVLTLMFTDILGATAVAARLGAEAWGGVKDAYDALIDREVKRANGDLADRAGDRVFATFARPADAILCACAIHEGAGPLGVDLRIGLHTGEVEDMGGKVSGIAIHVGARIMALAGAGEVLVSSTLKELVEGSEVRFEEKGQHDLKGVPGVRRLLRLMSR